MENEEWSKKHPNVFATSSLLIHCLSINWWTSPDEVAQRDSTFCRDLNFCGRDFFLCRKIIKHYIDKLTDTFWMESSVLELRGNYLTI